MYDLLTDADDNVLALLIGGQCYTFAQLKQSVAMIATGLQRDVKLEHGQRVVLYGPKTALQVMAMFAVWQCGGVVVIAHQGLKAAQLAHIMADSGAQVLITSPARWSQLAAEPAFHTDQVSQLIVEQSTSSLPEDAHVLKDWVEALDGPSAVTRCQQNDLAVLMYTSGSTGLPKGVMLTHKNLWLGADSVASYLQLTPQDRILALLPFSFDYGLNQLLSAWRVGASVVLHNYLLAKAVFNDVAKHGVTGLAGVPPLWYQLLKETLEPNLGLRFVTNSGGALTTSLIELLSEKFPQAQIFAMYGLTEAFRSSYLAPQKISEKPLSVGKAIPYARLLVLDEQQQVCPPGVVGELVHSGELVAQGYWGQPDLSAQRFAKLPEPLAKGGDERAVWSGDLAYMDDDGDLFIVGRQDQQIKTSGYRVSPQEVEAIAEALPDVGAAACLAVDDLELGQAIALFIEANPVHRDKLQAAYRANSANHLWPKYFAVVPQLPLTANGKLDRQYVKENWLYDLTNKN
nr:AMP-binding protein [Neiella litorisoli]